MLQFCNCLVAVGNVCQILLYREIDLIQAYREFRQWSDEAFSMKLPL